VTSYFKKATYQHW